MERINRGRHISQETKRRGGKNNIEKNGEKIKQWMQLIGLRIG